MNNHRHKDSYAEVHVNGDIIGYLTSDESQNAKEYIAKETVTEAADTSTQGEFQHHTYMLSGRSFLSFDCA